MDRFSSSVGKITCRATVIAVTALVLGCGGGGGGDKAGSGGGGGGGGGTVGGGTPAACGQPPSTEITISLVASRISGIAPLAVFFDATATTATTTARPFHDLELVWDFGDPTGGNWTQGSLAGVSSRNAATGPVSAHVFETPGTYTVCVAASDGTNVAAKTIDITVIDEDVGFTPSNTICFSTSGTFTTPCDALGVLAVTTNDFAAAMSFAGPNKRLLFRRGETFLASSPGRLWPLTAPYGPGMVGAYGAGAKPLIRLNGANVNIMQISNTGIQAVDWRVMDLEFDMLGNTGNSHGVQAFGPITGLLFLRVDMHSGHAGVSFSDPGVPQWDQIFFVDSTISNITGTTPGSGGGGGVFLSAKRFAFLGNLVDDTSQTEHVTRFPFIAKGAISNNTLRKPATGKAVIKLHGIAFPTYGTYTESVVISDNRLASAQDGTMLEVAPQTSSQDERLRNVIVERNWFEPLPGNFNRPFASISATDVTFRNNVGDWSVGTGFVAIGVDRRGAEPASARVNIYNNSIFSSRAGTHNVIELGGSFGAVSASQVKNNLVYAPNASGGSTVVRDLGTGNTVAFNTSNAQLLATAPAWTSTPPGSPAGFVLTAPSYLAGDPAVAVHSDFFRNARPGPGIDIGASEFP